jgi:hypothetical protein
MIVFTDIKFHINADLTIHGTNFELAATVDNFMWLLVSIYRLKADPKELLGFSYFQVVTKIEEENDW